MLQRRENSDSVAQLQLGCPGGLQATMSTWQLCTSSFLGTSHSGDTRASSWAQVWAWDGELSHTKATHTGLVLWGPRTP